MCGIFGVFSIDGRPIPDLDAKAALDAIRHRGPDDEGIWRDAHTLLGSRRLSIIDPTGGHQPMADESGSRRIVMNGEIYDYETMLSELQNAGHRFQSRCDTEVALHLLEGRLDDALERIDGQYAIAYHDSRRNRLLLVRDRTGICPLFYALKDGMLVFASEMKAIFASGLVEARIDVRSIDAVSCFGCVPSPRTLFEGVLSLPAGHYLTADRAAGRAGSGVSLEAQLRVERYWDIPYPPAGEYENRGESEWADELRGALEASVRRRLRSDAPVGLYLSGGIDSATVGALLRNAEPVRGRVFSIGFPERNYDESARTRRLASYLGLTEQYLRYSQDDLAADIPRLLYHAESPIISTESVPLFALSGLASRHVKVILTGEGSDEALGGYDYFERDVLVGRLESNGIGALLRPAAKLWLRSALGRDNPVFPSTSVRAWSEEIFGCYPAVAIQMFYWKALRAMTYSGTMLERAEHRSDAELVSLPIAEIKKWDPLNRSLYLSSRLFLQGHLLAAHGDRALMAHSVEGRYPFLDRQVQELIARVPPELKIRRRGVRTQEKHLLRRAMSRDLPREVLTRRKKPFLAPFGTPFVGTHAPEYVRELLSERVIRDFGYFDPNRIGEIRLRLERVADSRRGPAVPGMNRASVNETVDGMALVFALSVQLLEYLTRTTGYRSLPAGLDGTTR